MRAIADAAAVRRYFVDKGFLKADACIEQLPGDSSLENSVRLTCGVNKGPRIRIKDIEFHQIRSVDLPKKKVVPGLQEKKDLPYAGRACAASHGRTPSASARYNIARQQFRSSPFRRRR